MRGADAERVGVQHRSRRTRLAPVDPASSPNPHAAEPVHALRRPHLFADTQLTVDDSQVVPMLLTAPTC
ncbi:hypothetical protein [Micromonospora sp. NPDC051141]|uniref:hypothetical protein n=1 Tax=Micromonospora sp. NPDC051141 TaxID=3364284 RepID=UPI0037B45103